MQGIVPSTVYTPYDNTTVNSSMCRPDLIVPPVVKPSLAKPILISFDVNAMLKALSQQPISIVIHSRTKSFQNYAGGVYTGPECTPTDENGKPTKITHMMLAVGYNVTLGLDTAGSYIKIKNSYVQYTVFFRVYIHLFIYICIYIYYYYYYHLLFQIKN